MLGAAICLFLIPHAPAGIPVAASAAGALIGLRPRRHAEGLPVTGDAWAVIGALAVGTFAIKAAGPAVLGQRPLPDRLAGVIALLAPALLAGLVIMEAFSAGESHHIVLDARAVGLLAAVVGRILRLPLPVILVLAAAATALARL